MQKISKVTIQCSPDLSADSRRRLKSAVVSSQGVLTFCDGCCGNVAHNAGGNARTSCCNEKIEFVEVTPSGTEATE